MLVSGSETLPEGKGVDGPCHTIRWWSPREVRPSRRQWVLVYTLERDVRNVPLILPCLWVPATVKWAVTPAGPSCRGVVLRQRVLLILNWNLWIKSDGMSLRSFKLSQAHTLITKQALSLL